MARQSHTHKGHCQHCGRIHAVDAVSQIIAKHGYKVAGYGFFNGVCSGAEFKPMQLQRVEADNFIEQLIKTAGDEQRRLDGLIKGEWHPGFCELPKRWSQAARAFLENIAPWADCDQEQQRQAIKAAKYKLECKIKFCLTHSHYLAGLLEQVHGQPLIEAEDPVRKILLGDAVRVLNSYDSVVEGTRLVRCRGFSNRNITEVLVTRPTDSKKFWLNVRSVKRKV